MRWRIRDQVLIPLLTLLLGVAGITTWTALASAGRVQQQIEAQVRTSVRDMNKATLTYPLEPYVLELAKGLSGADYLVIDAYGRHSTTLNAVPRDLPAAVLSADDWQSLSLGQAVRAADEDYLCSAVRLDRGRNAGSTLYVFYPEALRRDALWEAVRPSLVLGGFAGLASLALAVGVSHRLSRRLRDLVRRTRLIADGDFSPMPLPGRNDELRDLGRAVNEMAERLARYQETARKTERLRLLGQVSAGLAHQLRNGLTGARLAVQLHRRACPGGAEDEALDVALRQLALLEAHLKRFLDLGRTGQLRREPCSLPGLVDEAVALLGPRCRHTHIELRWQRPPGDVTLPGDPAQLGELLLNVLGNAVEAAGPGGWVAVQVLGDGEGKGNCRVEVADSGPGPAPEVADRLFEPFVTGKPEGVGLGLAVAQQTAEAHGGRICWRRETDRTVFWIELPTSFAGSTA